MIVHRLVVCQRSRVGAYAVQVHIRAVRHEGQSLRLRLHEVVILLVAHRRAAVAVHVQFHQPAVCLPSHGECHLYTLALRVFRLHTHRHLHHYRLPRLWVNVLLVLAVYRRAALQCRALCSHPDALHAVLHAVHHH